MGLVRGAARFVQRARYQTLESLNQSKEIIVTINRQWRLKTRPSGLIGPEHFEYVETELADTGAEEV